MHLHTNTSIHNFKHSLKRTHSHTFTHIHTYTHTYTHTLTCQCSLRPIILCSSTCPHSSIMTPEISYGQLCIDATKKTYTDAKKVCLTQKNCIDANISFRFIIESAHTVDLISCSHRQECTHITKK